MLSLHQITIVDSIKRPERHHRGEGTDVATGGSKPGWLQNSCSQFPPDVIVVAGNDQGSGCRKMRYRSVCEQTPQLDLAFETRESQVDIGKDYRSGMARVMNAAMSHQGAAAFFETNCEVEVVLIDKRIAAQNSIAIAALLQADIALKGMVLEPHSVGKQLDLPVVVRARYAVVNFLQQDDIWLAVSNDFDDSFQPIASVGAADAFVDIVSEQAKLHFPRLADSLGNVQELTKKKMPHKDFNETLEALAEGGSPRFTTPYQKPRATAEG